MSADETLREAERLLRADPERLAQFLAAFPCTHSETEILWEEDSSSRDIGEIRWCKLCGAYRRWHGSERDAKWILPSRGKAI